MKKLKVISLIIIAAAAAVACTDYLNPEYVEITELGATVKTDTLSVDADDCTFPVKSNVNFIAKVVRGAEWLSFDPSCSGIISLDCDAALKEISLYSTANTGFPRMALVTLEANGRSDTVYVKQVGKYEQFMELGETEIIADPEGGIYYVEADTNVPARDIITSTDKDGVDKVFYKDNVLIIKMSPNSGRNDRIINMKVFCLDQWRREIGTVLTIKQKKLQ